MSEQKKPNRASQRKEYLALPSGVRGLEEEKKQRGTERRFQQPHTNTTVVLSLCMLCMIANHDYHTKSKAFPSAFESFLLKQTND